MDLSGLVSSIFRDRICLLFQSDIVSSSNEKSLMNQMGWCWSSIFFKIISNRCKFFQSLSNENFYGINCVSSSDYNYREV